MSPITPEPMPEPTPEILSLMRACEPFINNSHASELARAFNPPPKGSEPAEPKTGQLEAVYETACRLCDEENYQFAAALGLHLFAYKPTEPRYAFLAGNCMQRLGLNASAAKFFCYALSKVATTPPRSSGSVNRCLRWATRSMPSAPSMPRWTFRVATRRPTTSCSNRTNWSPCFAAASATSMRRRPFPETPDTTSL